MLKKIYCKPKSLQNYKIFKKETEQMFSSREHDSKWNDDARKSKECR